MQGAGKTLVKKMKKLASLRTRRRGITLLELLLATAIFIVLLSIVWSATSLLLRAEQRRMQQTEQQRTVRAWTQIISDDFLSAIQDTEQLNKAVGGDTIRHFGVSGTATQLRIDVSNYSWRTEESSELRTIYYDFHPESGFIRRERDYAALTSVSELVKTAPEIVSGLFRYYDGRAWHEHWSSLDRKSAPAAIEVTFRSLPFAEANRWRNQMPDVREPFESKVSVPIPAASQMRFEPYRRTAPPRPPEPERPLLPPPTPSSLTPPSPPPPSPFHSFMAD